jgi:hypothetical protein
MWQCVFKDIFNFIVVGRHSYHIYELNAIIEILFFSNDRKGKLHIQIINLKLQSVVAKWTARIVVSMYL